MTSVVLPWLVNSTGTGLTSWRLQGMYTGGHVLACGLRMLYVYMVIHGTWCVCVCVCVCACVRACAHEWVRACCNSVDGCMYARHGR